MNYRFKFFCFHLIKEKETKKKIHRRKRNFWRNKNSLILLHIAIENRFQLQKHLHLNNNIHYVSFFYTKVRIRSMNESE